MRKVLTATDIPLSGEVRIAIGTIVTPSAHDLIRERGLALTEVPEHELDGIAPPERTVAIGSDHGGFEMKEALKPVLAELGLSVRDVGVQEAKAADYPDIALQVAELVAQGVAGRGVIVDGAGIGSAMAANKVPGVRAALCYDKATARNSREHNHANVLTLGGRMLTLTQAEEVLRVWLATPYGGGRHAARVEKITGIEKRYAAWTRNS
jgi:ribose 5-phosphate isomerase B